MWKVKAHGCGNTAPATQHGDRELSGTERTLEQNRTAPAQKFDCKGVALCPQEKSLHFFCQHAFLCLLYIDELCSSAAGFGPRPGQDKRAPQPPFFFCPSSGLSGGPLRAGVHTTLQKPSEGGQGRQPVLVPLARFLSEACYSSVCGTVTRATAWTRLLRTLDI